MAANPRLTSKTVAPFFKPIDLSPGADAGQLIDLLSEGLGQALQIIFLQVVEIHLPGIKRAKRFVGYEIVRWDG